MMVDGFQQSLSDIAKGVPAWILRLAAMEFRRRLPVRLSWGHKRCEVGTSECESDTAPVGEQQERRYAARYHVSRLSYRVEVAWWLLPFFNGSRFLNGPGACRPDQLAAGGVADLLALFGFSLF